MPVSTYAVHRSAVVAEALHQQLDATPGLTCAGWATSASEALNRRADSPHVWVVDERLPHSGATVLCDVLDRDTRGDHLVVLAALAGAADNERVVNLVERGATGVVDVGSSWSTLVRAVRAVADGLMWLPPHLESDLSKSARVAQTMDDAVIRVLLRLTDREREVLLLLCRGYNRVEVSHTLHISAHTARTHVQRVIDKFAVHSQREVVALGLRHHLVERFADAPAVRPAP
jgi:DNA-binding NarL/FixJ family response regulator